MSNKFSIASLFPEFHSSEIDNKELEKIIRDAIAREYPGDPIKELEYTEGGIEVVLESGEEIEIEVDWQEIILA